MSIYFPTSIKQPFAVGTKHIKDGVSSIKEGKWSGGIFETCVGALEMVPIVNYGILSIEKQITLRTVDQKMNARREELEQEVQSAGVILQQLFFETHNSKVPGKLNRSSPIYETLEYSYPDRQFKILISQLEEFSQQLNNENKKEIEKFIQILKNSEPLACLITCLMQERNKTNRELLLNKFKEIILEKVTELPIGERLIIPYGYLGRDMHDLAASSAVGHMTVLEITKTDDETAQVRLFNSATTENTLENDTTFPWNRTVSFNDIAHPDFWQNTLGLLEHEQVNMSSAYDKLKELKEVPNKKQPPENLKSYRLQSINHCPKKSLQIWLHDMMKDNPILYQKFRIFNLDSLHQKATQIITSSSNYKNITVDHSVALWGGSDKVQNSIYNFYFKLRGFFSGPHVKQNLPLDEVQKMVDYDTVVNLSRNCRLKILENNLTAAIDDVLKSDLNIVHKAVLLQGLHDFCEKRKIKYDSSVFNFPDNELKELLKRPQLEENFLKLNGYATPNITVVNILLRGNLDSFINLLLTVAGVDQTINQVEEFYSDPNDQFKAYLIIYSYCLKNQFENSAAIKLLLSKFNLEKMTLHQRSQLAEVSNF